MKQGPRLTGLGPGIERCCEDLNLTDSSSSDNYSRNNILSISLNTVIKNHLPKF